MYLIYVLPSERLTSKTLDGDEWSFYDECSDEGALEDLFQSPVSVLPIGTCLKTLHVPSGRTTGYGIFGSQSIIVIDLLHLVDAWSEGAYHVSMLNKIPKGKLLNEQSQISKACFDWYIDDYGPRNTDRGAALIRYARNINNEDDRKYVFNLLRTFAASPYNDYLQNLYDIIELIKKQSNSQVALARIMQLANTQLVRDEIQQKFRRIILDKIPLHKIVVAIAEAGDVE